tara:strand:+ start:7569 stop:8312 length:744 start_codon:yes stop_codon:yes gene_type:complete
MLVTFGDSWVYGVAAGYTFKNPIPKEVYREKRVSDEFLDCSFRILLAKKMGIENINFSAEGSSNQKQFRLASEYFLRDKNIIKNGVVLWGITSVYRNEFFDTIKNNYDNFLIPDIHRDRVLSKILSVRYLSEKVEIEKLYYNMELFNYYFKSVGIKNYWYNIFNDHDYPNKLSNILFKGNSLLSVITNDYKKNNLYHKSIWESTDRKIKAAIKNKLVNPISLHPTKESHSKIANLLYNELQSPKGES